MKPRARRKDLLVQELDGEVLVYDLRSHRAHCLSPAAAEVWRGCDGRRTDAEVARRLVRAQGLATSDARALVQAALPLLERRRLLRPLPALAPRPSSTERRELLRRLGLAALVVSIAAPTAAQTATCLARNAACNPTSGAPCCPGLECCTFGPNRNKCRNTASC